MIVIINITATITKLVKCAKCLQIAYITNMFLIKHELVKIGLNYN